MNAITLRTRCTAQNAIDIHTINGNKAVNVNTALVEEILRATQIAVTFFTDTANKEDIADGLNLKFLQRTQNLQDSGQTASIITDTRS